MYNLTEKSNCWCARGPPFVIPAPHMAWVTILVKNYTDVNSINALLVVYDLLILQSDNESSKAIRNFLTIVIPVVTVSL